MAVQRTIRKSLFTAKVDSSAGETLRFRVDASGGPTPVFLFASRDHEYFRASDFSGHPKTTYRRKWPGANDPIANKTDIYSFSFGFLGATEYTLLAEVHAADGSVVKTIKDIDYMRSDQTDMFAELFRITVG